MIEIIRMFLYFKSFSNESERSNAWLRLGFWFFKANEMFGIEGVFGIVDLEIWLWVVSTICSLIELGRIYHSLSYVRFATRERNLVDPWAKHWVGFVFSRSKELFKVL
jgi:hypothetical protein